jgi:hypothetical protein
VFLVVLAVPVVAGVCGGAVLASWFAALCCLSLFCLFFFLLLFELDFLVEESALSFAIVFLLLLVSTPGFSSGVAFVVLGFVVESVFCSFLSSTGSVIGFSTVFISVCSASSSLVRVCGYVHCARNFCSKYSSARITLQKSVSVSSSLA